MADHYEIYSDPALGIELHTRFNRDQAELQKIDVNELHDDNFDYLGEWRLFMKETFGFAYRLGIISDLKDGEGDPMDIYFNFYIPVGRNGHKLAETDMGRMASNIETVIKMTSQLMALSNKGLHVVSIATSPPKYMQDELEEKLKQG
jgi:hypothetical protein